MADNRNYAALEWVIGEIEETLQQAQQALEAYVENPEDSTRIRFCLTHIHQVHGSLRMVEFAGAALLAEEMEILAQSLMDRKVAHQRDALEVLMRAILHLPIYLEQTKVTRRDEPTLLLPLLNDLRAVRGERLFSETRLFAPDLSAMKDVQGAPAGALDNEVQLQSMLQKLRKMFQYAAAAYIRDANPEENIGYLNKVFSRVGFLAQGTARYPLWEIVQEVGLALEAGLLEPSIALKSLLRRLDRELRVLQEGGKAAFDSHNSEALTKNFLYYLCGSDASTAKTQELRERYGVRQALPDEDFSANSQSLLDPETMETVVAALKDELEVIKHALDIGISGSDHTAVDDALPVMRRVADTLELIGIPDLRQQVLTQIESLEEYQEGGEPPANLLMGIASEMISMEQRLTAMTAAASRAVIGGSSADKTARIEIGHAQETVLREARNDLEKAKEAIIEYIASQWDVAHLMMVPDLLNETRGGLSMIPLARPSSILLSCSNYIKRELIESDGPPDWAQLDTLADAISSVEYYLERLADDADEEGESLMAIAENSVASLGYPVSGYKAIASTDSTDEHSDADAESVLEKMADVESFEIEALPEVADDDDPGIPELEADIEIEIDAEEQSGFLVDAEAFDDALDDSGIDSEVVEIADVGGLLTESETAAEDSDDEQLSSDSVAASQPDEMGQAIADEDEDADEVDPEIVEIFVEEAGEVLEAIDEYFPQWARDFDDRDALTEFRRAFHTLKGSGRMVQANDIGELAWAIENMLNRVMDGGVEPHSAQANLITRVRTLLPELIAAFAAAEATPHLDQIKQLSEWGDALAKGEVPPELVPANELREGGSPFAKDSEASLADSSMEQAQDAEEASDEDADEERDALWSIFVSEAETHLNTVGEFLTDMDEAAPLFLPPSESLQRALHTLKGSAHMADVVPVAELATPLERFVKELRTYLVNIDEDILQLLKDAVEYTEAVLEQIRTSQPINIPRLEQFLARVAELKDRSVGPMLRQREETEAGTKTVDPKLLSIFMAEAMDLLLDVDQLLDHWQSQPEDVEKLAPLIEELETLANGAEQAGLPEMAQMSRLLEAVYQSAGDDVRHLQSDDFSLLQDTHEALLDQVNAVAAGQNLQPLNELVITDLQDLAERLSEAQLESSDSSPVQEGEESPELDSDIAEEFINVIADSELEADTSTVEDIAAEPEPEPEPQNLVGADDLPDDIDLDIVEIFTEEADELMEEIEQFVGDWEGDWALSEPLTELKRVLHTLKGGARLAGMMGLGDVAHNFETYLINLDDNTAVNDAFFARVHRYQDVLLKGVETVKSLSAGNRVDLNGVLTIEADTTEHEEVAVKAATVEVVDTPVQQPPADESGTVVPFKPKDNVPVVSGTDSEPKGELQSPADAAKQAAVAGSNAAAALAVKRSAPQEIVKVSAELLEELVNLAGETSISRGRTEEQLSEMGFTLEEMDSTILRLQEQLRRLDIETEAQVLFRQEQMAESEDFDPLEMDRYSQLQQLSRSLIESASDLLDLKTTLSDKTRDTETLLLQQSRINTELQEGLMRSRMVPFSRLVPRLRRIVRQVSNELNKKINFELANVEGELDRTVLERMVAPLEHMLRNAVDHGIESPEERLAAGKSETGLVVLSLSREGGDVVLRLIDDGRGVSIDRIREKAIERGLMTPDANLNDREIMQFILHAGFSTAEAVTQISGRGVGLDVVHSEIKQLGGSMDINSMEGQGCEFTVRLPFTVSVNRALMVRVGDDRFAIPLNSIEGIVRVSPFELEHYYSNPDARFEYAGERYEVRYLGELLHSDAYPKLEGQAMPLPVVLVRSPQHTVAMQVDMLMGSREIVVKNIGSQFKRVSGLSGATVMGDGSVVIILDLHAMIRQDAALEQHSGNILLSPQAEDREAMKTVMVVDDSVTVRKVTSRVLEREGYEVYTAKDGADALLMLQDHIPDVMLLDIEMPRMDGFEVAKNIRSSSRLKDIPIIMITSRTGDKHREHALSLGVNMYMGKPYQEEVLLENIQTLIDS
ncbi:MAG: hypothetical protein AseanaTS_10440 [Candidatus Pelagadaptatus aseana]|uniref:hybrid sensor histidine kinase/response regulator n=1 Tax=Candidatus Pelagadaptatus aseana TaxID=3120508 RepID=UPI0039B30256